MALRFATSEKGKRKLIDNGHVYIKDKSNGEKTFWKCEYSRSKRCHGRVHTIGDSIAKRIGEHNHSGNACRAEVLDVMHNIIDRAVTTQDGPQNIVADALNLASQPALGQLTSVNNMKRVIRRARKRKGAMPANPLSLQDLVIPDEFKKTLKSQDFLLYDSGQGDKRTLIFSTHRNLQLLARSQHWYADGTFKTVPPLFAQLYTIHGLINNNIVPAVFVLMSEKTEESYRMVFSKLKQLEPSMRPISVMTDFETATVKAFQHEFIGIQLRGCFFHFCQCLYRNIQSNGLQHRYENDADFAMQMRHLPSLAFVPVEDVVLAFEELLSRVDFPLESQPVLDYFEDTWIGRPTRGNKRRPPRTPHSMWSCYDNINDDLPKTNNSCEGWHRSFSELIGGNHPTIWKFITVLQKEQCLNEAKIEQSLAGQPIQPQKKRYRDAASRIKKIVETYKEIDLMDYLRGLSHTLSF